MATLPFRILLPLPLDRAAEQRLAESADVRRLNEDSEPALLAQIEDVHGLIVRTHTHVTRPVIEAGTSLRVIGVAGVGTDRVDLAAAAERGIAVLHMADAASDAVAEFTVSLMLSLLRPVERMRRQLRAGEFSAVRQMGHGAELQSLVIGILGMGRIGSRVGRICASGFGSRVLYHDIAAVGPFPFPAIPATLDELLAESHILSLHVPLTPQTRGLFGPAALSRMRPGALLINTARGPVVDTTALVEALQSGRLGGAALDVTDPEPLPPDHPLLQIEQCIVTPHVAARTHAGLARMYGIVDRVLDFLIADEHHKHSRQSADPA